MKKVFIGGHPRSGTTLLGALIGTHSDCICTPESQFKTRVLRKKNIIKGNNIDLKSAFHEILKDWRFKIWGLKINTYPSTVEIYAELIEYIIIQYASKKGKYNPKVWVDHTPSNIKNAMNLLRLFPDAKFLHIVRDGRAVSASIMPLDWGTNTIYKSALSWKKRVTNYIKLEDELGSQYIKRIKFEDLVQSPEKTLKDICNFINIDYQGKMVEGTGFQTPIYTKKQHSLVGRRPDISEISAWKNLLTQRQIEIFESIAHDLLLSLGYEPIYGKNAKKITFIEKLNSYFYEFFKGKIINKPLHVYRIISGVKLAEKS